MENKPNKLPAQNPFNELLESRTPSKETTSSREEEKYPRLGLQGPLESFEGTSMTPLIQAALEDAGIEPTTYTPGYSGGTHPNHANYHGLLTTGQDHMNPDQTEISPIVELLLEGIASGAITKREVEYGTLRIPAYSQRPATDQEQHPNARLTSKLSGIRIFELADSNGEVIGYTTPLSSDGGRPGEVILSPRDVIDGQKPYRKNS